MKTIIHVDQATIKHNRKTRANDPPLIIRTYKGSLRAQELIIKGIVVFRHNPHKPLKCGARVWAETEDEVEIIK